MAVSVGDRTPHVLVVDDEESVADVYALLLDEYETSVAYGGEAALALIDESVDVVLLDRRMPDLSGDEVLAELRQRGMDCRVIMLTAVDPDFDILEMDFDGYLCKPVEQDDLNQAIERQLAAASYDERLSEYLEISSKLALLEDEKPAAEMAEAEDVTRLRQRASQLKADLDAHLEDLDDLEQAFSSISRL